MIIVLVPPSLYALVHAIAYFNYWRILQEQREYVRVHGQECIKKAVPIGDGNVFTLCKGEAILDGVGARLIVYDSSDQVALPSFKRSDLWNFTILSHYYGWRRFKFQGEALGGHFYSIDMMEPGYAADPGPDPILEKFIERYYCDYIDLKFSCKQFNFQSK